MDSGVQCDPNLCSLTVVAARNLLFAKNRRKTTEDCFIVIELLNSNNKWTLSGRHAADSIHWDETVQIPLIDINTDVCHISAYQKNFFGFDELLGKLLLTLTDLFDPDDTCPVPHCRWFPLKGKKNYAKYRGELSIRVEFSHNAQLRQQQLQSVTENNETDAMNVGGQKMRKSKSKTKSLSRFALTGRFAGIGRRNKMPKKKSSIDAEESGIISCRTLNASAPDVYRLYFTGAEQAGTSNECSPSKPPPSKQPLLEQMKSLTLGRAPRGTFTVPQSKSMDFRQNLDCVAEKDDAGSSTSLHSNPSSRNSLAEDDPLNLDNREQVHADLRNLARAAVRLSTPPPDQQTHTVNETSILSHAAQMPQLPRRPPAVWNANNTNDAVINLDLILDTLNREDLIDMIKDQRLKLSRQDRRIRDLEDYIDTLLCRIMNTKPDILQSPTGANPQFATRL